MPNCSFSLCSRVIPFSTYIFLTENLLQKVVDKTINKDLDQGTGTRHCRYMHAVVAFMPCAELKATLVEPLEQQLAKLKDVIAAQQAELAELHKKLKEVPVRYLIEESLTVTVTDTHTHSNSYSHVHRNI